jgi:hypothetical protein
MIEGHDCLSCPVCGKPLETAITAQPPRPKRSVLDSLLLRDIVLDNDPPGGDRMLAWASIRTSLTIFASGWVLIQVAIWLVRLTTEATKLRGEAASGVGIMLMLSSLALGAGVVHCVTGMCMSVVVPAEANARGWSRSIAVSLLVSLFGFLGLFSTPGPPLALDDVRIVMQDLCIGGIFVTKLLYTRFLRVLAEHLKLAGVVKAANNYVWCEGAIFFWVFVTLVHGTDANVFVAGPLQAVSNEWLRIFAFSALCVWFVGMVVIVRSALTETLAGRRRVPRAQSDPDQNRSGLPPTGPSCGPA